MEHLKRQYPARQFHPVLITELTRMHGGHYCVAGWNVHRDRIVRPLAPLGGPSGGHWVLQDGRLPLQVGDLIHCQPVGGKQGTPPHSTEDFLLRLSPAPLAHFNAGQMFDLLQPTVDASVQDIFGQRLVQDKYLPDGALTRSLGAICVPRREMSFHHGYKERLRIEVQDSEGVVYDIPVTCEALRTGGCA
jgi:hypothetical protein